MRRHGSAVVLERLATDRGRLDAIAGRLDEDFVEAVSEQPDLRERPGLDRLFRCCVVCLTQMP